MLGHFQMFHPCPSIAIFAIVEVQGVAFVIPNIDLGASYQLHLELREGERAAMKRLEDWRQFNERSYL